MWWRKKTRRTNRAEIAEELASIRVRRLVAASRVSTAQGQRFLDRWSEVQREICIELFLAHYTTKQLRALSDFYRSKIGRSIVETDRELEKEFQDQLRVRMEGFGREMEAERENGGDSARSEVREWGAGPATRPGSGVYLRSFLRHSGDEELDGN